MARWRYAFALVLGSALSLSWTEQAESQALPSPAEFSLVCILSPPFEWRNRRFVSSGVYELARIARDQWPDAKVITLEGERDNTQWAQVNRQVGCDRRSDGALNLFVQFYLASNDGSYTLGLFAEWPNGAAHEYRTRAEWESLTYLAMPPIDTVRPPHDALGVLPSAIRYDLLALWNEIAPGLGATPQPLPTGCFRNGVEQPQKCAGR